MQSGKERVCFGRVHWRLDNARRDGVNSDAPISVFDCQRTRDGVQPTLGERRQRRWYAFHGLAHERCGQVYDVAAALRKHLANASLRNIKEAGQVHRQLASKVGLGVLDKWLGNENPGVVDKRIDSAELLDRATDDTIGDRRIGDVTGRGEYVCRSIGLDGSGISDDTIPAVEKSADQPGADTL